jgi:pyrroline-5-carboxylate reductase
LTATAASAVPQRLAFIGGGNMAAALIEGWQRAGHALSAVTVVEPVAARRAELQQRYGVVVRADSAGLVGDLFVLAVKPQQMPEALAALKPAAGTVVLSIAAGVPLAVMAAALPGCHLIRSMPNTPALVGAGIAALFAAPGTPIAARAQAEALLSASGTCVWLEREAQLDAVTALSGSGPAYFFRLTEAMAAAGAALGLPAETATTLARQTFIGSAQLAAQREAPMQTLREQVTSKGGTTAAALATFESGGFAALVQEALTAAEARSRELGAVLTAAFADPQKDS